jgi:predicted phage terminase large subunit-like protein
MIEKTTQAWAESLNLCAENATFRYAGTRWHFADTSSEIIKRKAAIARVFTPTVDGTLDGEPVLWSRETLAKKWTDMGAFVAAAQLFQNPKLENTDGFLEGWLQYWPALTYANMNLYLLCDPAGEKKESSDYTVFMVVGLGPDQNYYVITMVRDRLSLAERTRVLFSLHQQYKPLITGYEKYGLQSDIEHIRSVQAQTNYRFGIKELGGAMPKVERIRRLGPKFEAGRVFLPETCARVNYLKERVDLVQAFRQEEYLAFPYSEHDDMLDCLSRIFDVGPVFPNAVDALSTFSERESNRDNSFDPLRFGL